MNELAIGIGLTAAPLTDLSNLGSAFVSEMTFVGTAWLGLAAVLSLIVLPLALRRAEPTSAPVYELPGDHIRAAA